MLDFSEVMAWEAGRDYEREIERKKESDGYEPSYLDCLADMANDNIKNGKCSRCGGIIEDCEDEDKMSDIHSQVNMFGMESLTEAEQMLLGVYNIGIWCHNCYGELC